jgi:hypothetical protein
MVAIRRKRYPGEARRAGRRDHPVVQAELERHHPADQVEMGMRRAGREIVL